MNTTSVAGNTPVTVTLSNGLGGSTDWLGVAATGAPDTSYLQWTYVGTGVTKPDVDHQHASNALGRYEFRLFKSGYTRVATSASHHRAAASAAGDVVVARGRPGRRRRLHAHGERQQLPRLVGGPVERRRSRDDLCERFAGACGDPRKRRRERRNGVWSPSSIRRRAADVDRAAVLDQPGAVARGEHDDGASAAHR